MVYLIWGGAAVTVLGVLGLLGCGVAAARANRAGLPEAEMRARLGRLVAWNYGALGVALIGLMVVVVGLVLR